MRVEDVEGKENAKEMRMGKEMDSHGEERSKRWKRMGKSRNERRGGGASPPCRVCGCGAVEAAWNAATCLE